MVISSLVVETLPPHTQAAADALARIDGVEVHELVDTKIVVTIEADSVDDSYDVASGFIQIEGVIGVELVYANFEDDPSVGWGAHITEEVAR